MFVFYKKQHVQHGGDGGDGGDGSEVGEQSGGGLWDYQAGAQRKHIPCFSHKLATVETAQKNKLQRLTNKNLKWLLNLKQEKKRK